MTSEGFLNRLKSGKPVSCVYRHEGLSGLISAWLNGGLFILTWEECPDGQQYDESTYTRDERRQFETAEDLLAFVEKNGHPSSAFCP
jgi:hypothetical protein